MLKNKRVKFNIFLKVFQGFHLSSPPAPRHQTGFQLGQDKLEGHFRSILSNPAQGSIFLRIFEDLGKK